MLGFPRYLGDIKQWPQVIFLDPRRSRFLQTLDPNTLGRRPAFMLPKASLGTPESCLALASPGTSSDPLTQ